MDRSQLPQFMKYAGCGMIFLGMACLGLINILNLFYDFHWLCFLTPVIPLLIAGVLTGIGWLMDRMPT